MMTLARIKPTVSAVDTAAFTDAHVVIINPLNSHSLESGVSHQTASERQRSCCGRAFTTRWQLLPVAVITASCVGIIISATGYVAGGAIVPGSTCAPCNTTDSNHTQTSNSQSTGVASTTFSTYSSIGTGVCAAFTLLIGIVSYIAMGILAPEKTFEENLEKQAAADADLANTATRLGAGAASLNDVSNDLVDVVKTEEQMATDQDEDEAAQANQIAAYITAIRNAAKSMDGMSTDAEAFQKTAGEVRKIYTEMMSAVGLSEKVSKELIGAWSKIQQEEKLLGDDIAKLNKAAIASGTVVTSLHLAEEESKRLADALKLGAQSEGEASTAIHDAAVSLEGTSHRLTSTSRAIQHQDQSVQGLTRAVDRYTSALELNRAQIDNVLNLLDAELKQ